MQKMTTSATAKRRLTTTLQSDSRLVLVADWLPFDCDMPLRSRGRMETNHATTHRIPTAPTTWNGKRQLPGASVNMTRITSGVMMAPMDAPLCSTLLPIVRSCGESRRWVVFNAQGQWPASNSPSIVRQMRSWLKSVVHAERKPIIDQANRTAGYSQRTLTRSAMNPKSNEPAAKAQPKASSRSPYCSFDNLNSLEMRTATFASVWRSM